jgi:hypothetical protein
VEAARDLMLSPALYRFLRSAVSLVRSAPVTRVFFLSLSVKTPPTCDNGE